MATIEYKFSDGHIEEIEVTEEFAKQYKEIDKEYLRNEEKFDWRTRNKEMSLERLQKEFGMDMPDDAPAVDEQVINEDFIKRFISVLTEPQKEIFKIGSAGFFKRIYQVGRSSICIFIFLKIIF